MAQGDLFSQVGSRFRNQNRVDGRRLYTDMRGSYQQAGKGNAQYQRDLRKLMETELQISQVKKDALKADVRRNGLMKGMSEMMKKVNKMNDAYMKNKREHANLEKQLLKTSKALADEEAKGSRMNRDKVRMLRRMTAELESQERLSRIQLDQARRMLPLGKRYAQAMDIAKKAGEGMKGLWNDISGIMSGVSGIFDLLMVPLRMMGKLLMAPWQKFLEIQSITGNLAADIGLTNKESYLLKDNFAALAMSALQFGGSMQDVATAMQVMSEQTGKNTFFNPGQMKQLVEMAYATGLGVEGATTMMAMYDNMGMAFEKGIELTNEARQTAAKYNLNNTKLLQNLGNFTKQLTGFEFKNGMKALTTVVAKAESLRFNLDGIGSLSNRLFDPEGAVEAAAQLNVLGGRFAQFGDPFGLMYAAQNAPEELAKGLMEMTKGMAKRNKEGNFFISPADRKMIQQAAEALGQDADNLINAAIEQGKLADKMASNKFLRNGMFSEEQQTMLGNLMKQGEKGWEIRMPSGMMKLVSSLGTDDLNQILDERKKNDQAAIERKNWSERLNLMLEKFVVGLTKPFQKFEAIFNNSNLMGKIEDLGQTIAEKMVPWFDSIFDENGKVYKFIDSMSSTISSVFDSITQFFSKDDSPFLSKLGSAVGNLVMKLADTVWPYMQYGLGKLFEAMGGIPMVGSMLRETGLEMQQKAAISNKSIAGFSGLNTAQGQASMNQKLMSAYEDNDTGWGTYLAYGGIGARLGAMFGPWGAAIGGALGLGAAGLQDLLEDSPSQKVKNATHVNDGVVTSSGQVVKYPKGELLAVLSPQQNASSGGVGGGTLVLSGTIKLETPAGNTTLTLDDFKKAGIHVIAAAISNEQNNTTKGYGLNDSKDIRTNLAI